MNPLSKAAESSFEVGDDDGVHEMPMIKIVANKKCTVFLITLELLCYSVVYTKLNRPPGATSPLRYQSIGSSFCMLSDHLNSMFKASPIVFIASSDIVYVNRFPFTMVEITPIVFH